jgi:hypothetical protein
VKRAAGVTRAAVTRAAALQPARLHVKQQQLPRVQCQLLYMLQQHQQQHQQQLPHVLLQ